MNSDRRHCWVSYFRIQPNLEQVQTRPIQAQCIQYHSAHCCTDEEEVCAIKQRCRSETVMLVLGLGLGP